MFDPGHYVPIMKSKRGEHRALEALAPSVREGLTPLFEVPFIQPYEREPRDPNQDPQTIEDQIDKTARYLQEYWFDDVDPRYEDESPQPPDSMFSGYRPVFVDLRMLEVTQCAGGEHPFVYLRDATIGGRVKIIPVTGLRRGQRYQEAVREVADAFGQGVMLRIEEEDFERDLEEAFEEFLAFHETTPSGVDLMLDLKEVSGSTQARYGALGMTGDLPSLQAWRTFTLASAGFPADFPAGNEETVSCDRNDWKIWKGVIQSEPARQPTYADYGVRGREIPSMDVPVQPNPKFAYTDDERWIAVKKGKDGRGYARFIDICQELVRTPAYAGPGYSMGDEQIDAYVRDSDEGPGNGESWVLMSVNHHLTHVVNQLSNRPAPSGGGAQF